MKKLFLIFIITLGLMVLFACQRGERDAPTIALVVKTQNNPFFVDMENGAKEAAAKLGVNLVVQAAEREVDVEKQMQIIENLIQRRVNAICVSPSGSKEIVPAIVKANKAGVPVLIIDSGVDEETLKRAGGYIATFIGSDNFEGGKLAGEYIIKKLSGKGKVAILEGIPGHETADARRDGFQKAIDKAMGIEIAVSQVANSERDKGFNVFQNILQSHPEVQALFATNDMMALGAVEAIAAAGRTGEIIVVGFDAVDDARQAIQKGLMHGSIAQFPAEMGRLAVENAVRLMNGENIPDYIPVKIELVTAQ